MASVEIKEHWLPAVYMVSMGNIDQVFPYPVRKGYLVVTQQNGHWQVSGMFDLMETHFGNGETDLSRPIAEYLNEDAALAGVFFAAYRAHKPLRSGFARRFPISMLLDRAILWSFFQRQGWCWWPETWTFRDWVNISHQASFSISSNIHKDGRRERTSAPFSLL